MPIAVAASLGPRRRCRGPVLQMQGKPGDPCDDLEGMLNGWMELLPQHASRSSGLGPGGLQMSHQPPSTTGGQAVSLKAVRGAWNPKPLAALKPPFRRGIGGWLTKRGFGPMQPCFASCGSVQVSDLSFWRLHTTSSRMLDTSGNRHVAGASLFSVECPLCLDWTQGKGNGSQS